MAAPRARKFRLAHLLLLLPLLGLVWVPFYDRAEPALFGIPFFYWYQLLWIPLGSVVLFLLYRIEGEP